MNGDTDDSIQSEVAVAVSDTAICMAWNDWTAIGTNRHNGFGHSSDSGTSFSDHGSINTVATPQAIGDPGLVYSVRDDAFFFSAINVTGGGSPEGASVWRSSDCETFSHAGIIVEGYPTIVVDKSMIAVDNYPDSPGRPHFGRLHAAWHGIFGAQVAFSQDGGVTWSTPVTPPGLATDNVRGMWPAVAPNHDVYVAVLNTTTQIGGPEDQWIYKSTDGGATWVQMTDIATGRRRPENAAASASCAPNAPPGTSPSPALKGRLFQRAFPQIATHPEGSSYVIHAVYAYDSDGVGSDESNIFYRRSTDGAVSWSTEVKLNDDSTSTDQWLPALAVNSDGIVAVSWYDRRNDPVNNLSFDRYAVVSMDGGLTWGPNRRVSDPPPGGGAASPVSPEPDGCYHGDYDQLAIGGIGGSTVHVVWSDDRSGNPDVYYDQLDLDQDAVRDSEDSCVVAANGAAQGPANQCDTDQDGYGNVCDPDFDQSFVVDSIDLDMYFTPAYTSGTPTPTGTDLNCDGTVTATDFGMFFVPKFKAPPPKNRPGPSGLTCAGSVPCP